MPGRDSDEAVEDPKFLELSYAQAQDDYLWGAYPVDRTQAVTLCALQASDAAATQHDMRAHIPRRYGMVTMTICDH